MNEVAAVTRRLIEGLLDTRTIVPVSVAKADANGRDRLGRDSGE
jgi:hypothetical protein